MKQNLALDIPQTTDIQEPFAGKLRAGQIAAILRLTPVMMIANLLNVATVDWLFWDNAPKAFLLIWSALTILVVITGFRSWWRNRPQLLQEGLPSTPRSKRSIKRMIISAGTMALIWSLVPISLFSNADPGGQIFIAVLTTGMMSAGALALSTVPVAALLYTAILALSAAYALFSAAEPAFSFIGVILFIYTWILAKSATWKANMFVSRLVDQAKLEKQNELIGLLLRDFEESASDWLWEFDEHGHLQHVSARLATMLDKPIEMLQGVHYRAVFCANTEHDEAGSLQDLYDQISRHNPFRNQVVSVSIAGSQGWWSLCGKPVYDDAGTFRGYRGVGADVTETKRAQARIAQMARFDELTGLPNRACFRETLNALPMHASSPLVAVLYIDLDEFKTVNDTMGHAIGDHLLVSVAERLVHSVGGDIGVSRLAGDEFAILLNDAVTEEAVLDLAASIIHSLNQPYQLDGKHVQIGASIGIALSHDCPDDPEQLLKNADLALYAAKRDGRGRFRQFSFDIDAALRKRREMASDLQAAIAAGALSLHYQPIVAACDNRLVGFEALLRWTHPERGMISPAEFIPIAEEYGLMDDIGTWVVRRACVEAASWPLPLKVAVNLSPTQFHNKQFLNIMLGAIGTSGLAPQRLELEVTETALLAQNAATVDALNHLRSLGVRISLDDFGTGYASLAYLRSFPFDKIKIDQSFVRDALDRPDCAAIVKAATYLADNLDMISTAEGVETYEQFEWLRAIGVDEIQGYLFSKPRAVEDLRELFEEGEYALAQVA